jgi:hypothetical protein
MNNSSKDARLGISDLRVAAVLIFVILNLAVFLIRLISVWRYGALFPTTGGERLVIYPIWKAIHHLPIYDWPLQFPFALALYNYLFYSTYAFYLKLVGAWGADILIWGRLFTPVFAIIGALAQWKLVQSYLNLRGARSLLSLFFSLGLWFCASIVRQWALSIRPDMAAVALVMIALWVVVRQPRFAFAYAGVFFYLAWSFKQSVVLALVGVCLFLLLQKRWRDLSMLATVFAVLAAATVFLGTPEYRFNVFVAPGLVKEFNFLHALPIDIKTLCANAYWVLAPIALLFAAGMRRAEATVRLLTTVLVVALIGGLLAMAKVGAWDHYLLEAFVAGSTLLQFAVFQVPGRLASALVLFGCVQPAVQLATVPAGTHPHLFGTVGIATAAEYSDAVALRERLAPLKKPIFTSNEIFSLPWFSSDNRAPVLIVDTIFHDATRDRCQNGCVEGMLKRGEIPTVLLLSDGDPYRSSLSPYYQKAGEALYAGRKWSIYTLDSSAPTQTSTAKP